MSHTEPDKLLYGDVVVNVDAIREAIVKNYSPQHVHLKFKVMVNLLCYCYYSSYSLTILKCHVFGHHYNQALMLSYHLSHTPTYP